MDTPITSTSGGQAGICSDPNCPQRITHYVGECPGCTGVNTPLADAINAARSLDFEALFTACQKQHALSLESDSIVASCGCLTKTPDANLHKPGCKYRLISERDAAIRDCFDLRGQLAVCEEHAGTMARDFDASLDVVKAERDDYKNHFEACEAQRQRQLVELESLRKDLCEIADGCKVGCPDREEAKRRIIAIREERDKLHGFYQEIVKELGELEFSTESLVRGFLYMKERAKKLNPTAAVNLIELVAETAAGEVKPAEWEEKPQE